MQAHNLQKFALGAVGPDVTRLDSKAAGSSYDGSKPSGMKGELDRWYLFIPLRTEFTH